jgi:thiol-disulfide isomerase/thioredoxin
VTDGYSVADGLTSLASRKITIFGEKTPMNSRSSAVCLLLIVTSLSCFSQKGYNLRFHISGLKDTTAYLGYFINESTFIKDTALVNDKGEFAFSGAAALPQGVYMLVLNKTKQFEFVVGADQDFALATTTADYVQNMKVTGDADNSLFFESIFFNIARNKEAEPFIKVLRDSTLKDAGKQDARESLKKINEKVIAYHEDLIKQNPATLTARMIKATEPVRIPDPPKRADGTLDSTFQLKWYRQHFFDNFDLSDDALVRLSRPLYSEKINEFLDKLYAPQADTITKAIRVIVDKAKKNPETYKYAVFLCLRKYQDPAIMGLDEVFVNLYDLYFASGEMDFWATASIKKNFKDLADRYRKSLVGQTGDNLIMQDSNFKRRSLYDIKNKYSILYIFDPDCGHCKIETPKLVNFYNKRKFDLEVFAVSADTSMAKMRKYIKDMQMKWITVNGPRTYVGPYSDHYDAVETPTLYVLDSKKKIIGKKVPVDKLEEFFTQYERMQKLRSHL